MSDDAPLPESDGDPVICSECENVVHLVLTDDPAHQLQCECPFLAIDISDALGDSSLFHPLTGNWDNINESDDT